MVRKIFLVLLILFIVIQFFRPARNVASGTQSNFIVNSYSVPAEVNPILEKACLDCHSNNTRYPWYNKIQPIAWWLNMHVKDGKEQLNFDEFLSYSVKKQDKKMDEVIKEVKGGGMPLNSYTWIHKDAKLTSTEKTLLINWATNVRKEITTKTGYVPQLEK